MQTEILLESAHSAEESGYVTQHFRDLQGLRWAGFWGTTLLFELVRTPWIHKPRQAMLLFFPAISVSVVSFLLMPRWYQHRYGFLAHSVSPKYHLLPLKIGLFALLAIFFGSMFISNGPHFVQLLVPGLWLLSMGLLSLLRACERNSFDTFRSG
jgi:hypothetical protein